MKRKKRRLLHINDEVWFWWVKSGNFGEATHVTIRSPTKKYYKVDPCKLTENYMYVGLEGCLPTGILPSRVKEYILNEIIKS